MAAYPSSLAVLCFLALLSPLCCSQSGQSEQRIHDPEAPPGGHLPPPAARIEDLLRKEKSHISSDHIYGSVTKDNEKVGIFMAAAAGTIALMAVMFCIYSNFYTKNQYLHTPLQDDLDFTLNPPEAVPVSFHGSLGVMNRDREVWKASNTSISDTPSIINVPPSLSPPPSLVSFPPPHVPFPPLFLSSYHLRTISAKDLEKSCV